MNLQDHKEGRFAIEIYGELVKLQVKDKTKICFESGNFDCLTISEIIGAAGYDATSLLKRKLLITIEDEI